MRRGALVRILACALGVFAVNAHAGGPLSVCGAAKTPVKYPGAGTVNLNYDQGNLGTRAKAQADAIITNAVALWTNVSTATVTIGRGADLGVDVTAANYTTFLSTFNDGINPVIYDTDGSIIDAVFGANAKNSTLGFAGSAFSGSTCTYLEGRAVVSGFLTTISDTTMGVTMAHEIGHLIGMDHTQLNATQGIASSGNRPLMYPTASRNTVTLHEDDIAAVTALYPDTNVNSVYGELSGTFKLIDAVTAVPGANLWATETTTGAVYSIVSDYRTQGTGFFRLLLPAGTYTLRAGTIQSTFIGGSSVGPYSETAAGLSFQAPLYSGTTPMANVTLGNAAPTQINVVPGCAAGVIFRLDGTGTVSGNCGGPTIFSLDVGKLGTGSGTIASSAGGINCGSSCTVAFAPGATVNLTATPTGGSVFFGWGGACTGTGACTVVMGGNAVVTATFLPAGTEIFPPDCALPAGWTVPAGANSGWSVATNEVSAGACSLRSNPIGDSQKAQIQFAGNFIAGNVSFARRVSSETDFDCFRFLIDGIQQAVGGACPGAQPPGVGASGELAYTTITVPITAGNHTVTWSYEKDINTVGGLDAAFIDAVSLPLNIPGVVQLSSSTASVAEGAGNAIVTVNRVNGAVGAASVAFTTTSGTATAGSDFTAQTGTLTWADGDSAAKTITIPINADMLIEGNETFTLTLSNATGASLGTPSTITVTITDDDFATAPGAPTLTAAVAGNGQATVTFTAPASNGGSPITNYTATCDGSSATGAFSPIVVSALANNVTVNCVVTATNNIGTGPQSNGLMVTPTAGATIALDAVFSRKTHAGAGAFDIVVDSNQPIGGAVTVEPRVIGAGHQVVFRFNVPVTGVGSSSVSQGAATHTFSGNEVIVNVTGITDNQRATVSVTGVTGAVGNVNASASLGFLVGDISSSRTVTAADISAVKARSNQAVTATTARYDLNLNGTINSVDVSVAKARAGVVLP